ncbi:MAG: RNA ligase family protein [Verrucomicrobiales bacterium]
MNGFIKYPRTPHLPWSPGATSDDAYLADCGCFAGREVVVTEKMDGENTTLYRGGLHARSPDSRHHPSRDWVKALHGSICAEIPEGWRLCGENVYARHSVAYAALDSYFYLFSVWDGSNQALGWDETAEWASLLGLSLAPVLWRGAWDEAALRSLAEEIDTGVQEGYVVRVADGFGYDDFSRSLAKWVRPHHVQTDQHWMHAPVVPNELKPPSEDESES